MRKPITWQELTPEQREEGKLEIKPETFARQGYGSGISGFDIAKMMSE